MIIFLIEKVFDILNLLNVANSLKRILHFHSDIVSYSNNPTVFEIRPFPAVDSKNFQNLAFIQIKLILWREEKVS